MPLAPLWTKLVVDGDVLPSNAAVESFFKTMKQNLLRSRTNFPAGDFLRLIISDLGSRVKADIMAQLMKDKKEKKTKTRPEKVDVEQWGPKRKKGQRSYRRMTVPSILKPKLLPAKLQHAPGLKIRSGDRTVSTPRRRDSICRTGEERSRSGDREANTPRLRDSMRTEAEGSRSCDLESSTPRLRDSMRTGVEGSRSCDLESSTPRLRDSMRTGVEGSRSCDLEDSTPRLRDSMRTGVEGSRSCDLEDSTPRLRDSMRTGAEENRSCDLETSTAHRRDSNRTEEDAINSPKRSRSSGERSDGDATVMFSVGNTLLNHQSLDTLHECAWLDDCVLDALLLSSAAEADNTAVFSVHAMEQMDTLSSTRWMTQSMRDKYSLRAVNT